jgi:beta-glucanase (GH16 family)
MIDFCNYKWTTAMEGGRQIHTGQPWMWYDGDAVYEDNGTSELSAYREPNTIHHWDGKTYRPNVACGLLRSVDTFGYGTFSARIMLPKGRNLWPAFWLCGSGEPWPACGEIDICEAWTNRFGGYFKLGIPQPPYLVPSWNTTTNIHWHDDYQEYWNYDGHKSCGSRRLPLLFSLKRPAHNYIKYEVEWRPDIITFRVNGKRVRTYGYHVAKRLNKKRMRVIIDLWTTGEDFTCDSPMKIRNFEYKPMEIL